MNNIIVCRKCSGNHLTMKCGREPDKKIDPIINEIQKPEIHREEYKSKNTDYKSKNTDYNYKRYEKYTVKLSELPDDITESELYRLLENWGHVSKIKIMQYSDCYIAYIDFNYKDEAEYFVSAIDSTPFDLLIIKASLCN